MNAAAARMGNGRAVALLAPVNVSPESARSAAVVIADRALLIAARTGEPPRRVTRELLEMTGLLRFRPARRRTR